MTISAMMRFHSIWLQARFGGDAARRRINRDGRGVRRITLPALVVVPRSLLNIPTK